MVIIDNNESIETQLDITIIQMTSNHTAESRVAATASTRCQQAMQPIQTIAIIGCSAVHSIDSGGNIIHGLESQIDVSNSKCC